MEKTKSKYFSLKPLKGYETNPGTNLQPVYRRVFDPETKAKIVKETKKIDLYKQIQGYASACDYEVLKQQFFNGEAIPENPNLVYGDLSKIPHNIHEAMEVANKAQDIYAGFPDYVKDAFGSFDNFHSSVVQGTASRVVGNAIQREFIKQKLEKEKELKGGDDSGK